MHSSSYQPAPKENAGFGKAITLLLIAAGIGLVVALIHAWFADDFGSRFMHAYAVAFAFILSLAIGSLFFILINHLSNAGWSVLLRRVVEALALNIVLVAVLFLPIAGSVVMGNGWLYHWAQPDNQTFAHHYNPFTSTDADGNEIIPHKPVGHDNKIYPNTVNAHHGPEEHGDEAHAPAAAATVTAATDAHATQADHAAHADTAVTTDAADTADAMAHGDDAHAAAGHHELDKLTLYKRGYLNRPFFIIRWIFYFIVWTLMAWYFWSRSVKQDTTGDFKLTEKMHVVSAPCLFVYGVTITLAAFDLLMSIESHWFSTIFGVYYFAGSMLCTFSFLVLFLNFLQKSGRLTKSITTEHYHDLGKFMFGFVFFWSYIAFSQYMLTWYSNMPEETFWYHMRGVSTQTRGYNPWTWVSLLILFGHFVIPFAGLLSRHVKRNNTLLICWAVWLVVMHWVDMVWVVMPSLSTSHVSVGLAEVGLTVALLSIYLVGVLTVLSKHSIVPLKDPRLGESLAFQNM